MPRYVAFLRGVSPSNLKMSDLKSCLEGLGLKEVKTILSSGNAAFNARGGSEGSLEKKIEAGLEKSLGHRFPTIVRSVEHLKSLLESDPFGSFKLAPGSKRVISFLKQEPRLKITLPVKKSGAAILRLEGREAFSAYVPSPEGPVFMTLIQKTFGQDVTTRTWETVQKTIR